MITSALIDQLRVRGFALSVTAGSLRVRPVSQLTPAEREAIRGNLRELIAALTAGEAWKPGEAVRLMEAADAQVERLGVDGQHPAVAAAAELVTRAHATRDMETVRFAVAEFVAVVCGLAAHPVRAGVRIAPQGQVVKGV